MIEDTDRSEAERAALDANPALPRDEGGPVFAAPWQAQAFALAVALNEASLFTWPEWTDTFAAELRRDEANPAEGCDIGDRYFLCWLAALEKLVARKGAATPEALAELKAAWDRAARATPHGKPIVLGAEKA